MGIEIQINKVLEDFWATEEEFKEMDDKQIIEFIWEDISALLENAKFKVIRKERNENVI